MNDKKAGKAGEYVIGGIFGAQIALILVKMFGILKASWLLILFPTWAMIILFFCVFLVVGYEDEKRGR